MTPTPTIDRRPIVPQRGSQREEKPVLRLLWTILWDVCRQIDHNRCYGCRWFDDCDTPAHRAAWERFLRRVVPLVVAVDVGIVLAVWRMM